MSDVHIMNNMNGPMLVPLSMGYTGDKVGRMVKFATGWNRTSDDVLRLITGGGVDAKGRAKGGSAGEYFNKRHLQVGEPLDGQEVHDVPEIRGLRRSQRTQRRRDEQGRIAQLEAMVSQSATQIAQLLAKSTGVDDVDHLLDPRAMNLDDLEAEIIGLDGSELTDVLSLEFKRSGGARKGAIDLITAAMKS